MVLVSWQLTNQWMGGTREDRVFGKVEVFHASRLIPNLTFSTITLKNESTKDLNNVVVNITAGQGLSFFVSTAAVRGSSNNLPFTPEFQAALGTVAPLPEGDATRATLLEHVQRRRDYLVPVWNRESVVDIRILGETPFGTAPTVRVAIDHVGVRALYQPPKQKLLGEDPVRLLVFGLFGGLLFTLVLPDLLAEPYGLALAGFVVGSFAGVVGWAIIRFGRFIFKLLG